MNSYPPELLAQLAPVMFVAGLDAPPTSPNPQSPNPRPQDPFLALSGRLREALISQRKVAIWQPDKSKKFHVVLVDPEARFPPRKIAPAEDQQFHTPHSPLSPLTPSSPLHPDGLIAPIWIRKHTTLVPSVFVLFKRIYEHPSSASKSPLDHDTTSDREREAEERRRDTELAAEIAQRKKTTNERSIKLTVVLMASRKMLDDPALDARLTFIRRQSGLDPRAALFVLSPVTSAEIGEFVHSLQEALWEPAIDYYTNHSKRVRRKRNRHTQTNTAYQQPLVAMGSTYVPRPLRPEGWSVRYEYKMGCFAEFRGEDDIALKHYHDAYSALHIMFGSTAILPPRTKRWAEAKVLADCISVKICKLYLYNNEHAMALSHHSSHMRMFSDLSRGWGIGEETFEFWSWLARQHRVFAELLEQGTRSTLKIPNHLPTPGASNPKLPDIQRGPLEVEGMRALGLNPSSALQHPGFYYYMAAKCTESRRDRFLAAVEDDGSHLASSPGFTNEKKVDHLSIVLELYTRAYELFKKYNTSSNQAQGRLTLWIAYLIAQTYHESGKFDMAVRFFERIAKTYRREQWDALLRPLLSTWYRCAQQLGNMELSVQLLFEILGHGPVDDQDDPEALEEDLIAVLKSTVPSSDQLLTVDISESGPLLDTSVIFWKPHVTVNELAAFQIILASPEIVSLASLPFTSLTIQLSNGFPLITIEHEGITLEEGSVVQKIDLGNFSPTEGEGTDAQETYKANLRWEPGSALVLCGCLSSSVPGNLSVTQLALTLKEGTWNIELPLQPNSHRLGTISNPRWLSSINPPRWITVRRDNYAFVTVRHRPHHVQVSLKDEAPAYLGEEFPITLDVTNIDDRELDISVDILLQPTEIEEADNFISLDGQRSNSLIKGVALGVLAPGVNITKTMYLGCSGAVGDRVIDISVQSRTSSSAEPTTPVTPQSPSVTIDAGETLRTLVVPTVDPIMVTHHVSYRQSTKPATGLGSLDAFESDYWEDAGEAHVTTTMTCVGPSGVYVESIKLLREDGSYAKVTTCLVDTDEADFCTEWLDGDEFCDQCQIALAHPDEPLEGDQIPGPGIYEVCWRRLLPNDQRGTLSITRFKLPPLKPPSNGLVALLKVPNTAKLHKPIPLQVTIRNGHPTKSANIIVQLEPDPVTDSFVVAGLRSGRLPILLPGAEEVVRWNLVPVECGWVKVPKIKVMNRRPPFPPQGQDTEPEGESVEIVDVRWDHRSEETSTDVRISVDAPQQSVDGSKTDSLHSDATVLVLP